MHNDGVYGRLVLMATGAPQVGQLAANGGYAERAA